MADEVKTEEVEQKPFDWTSNGDQFSASPDAFSDQLKEDINNISAIENLVAEMDNKHFNDPLRVAYVVSKSLLTRLIAPAIKEFETKKNKIESKVIQQ